MSRIPVIVRNPAYMEEMEPKDSWDSVSGESLIVNAPASDDEAVERGVVEDPDDESSAGEDEEDVKQVLQEAVQCMASLNEDLRSILSLCRDQATVVPDIDVYDTGKATEEEYRVFPNQTRKELMERLNNQVWNMLHLLQERVNQGIYNETDIKLIEGLQVVLVLQARLNAYSELAIKTCQES